MNRNKRIPTSHLYANLNDYTMSNNFGILGFKAFYAVGKYLNNSERAVAGTLLRHINYSDNSVKMNYTQITKIAHVNRNSVASAIKRLSKLKLVYRLNGLIYINPDWIHKGTTRKYHVLKARYYRVTSMILKLHN